MEAQALITQYITDELGTATANPETRAKGLRNLQDVVKEVVNHRNWAFRYGTAEITFTAGRPTTTLLPLDYLSWGPAGGLYIKNGVGKPINWMPQATYIRLLETEDRRETIPRAYTELQTDDDGRRTVALYPSITADITCVCHYYRNPPEITDGTDGALNFIPPTWHSNVLYNGLVWMSMKDSANIQSKSEQRQIYENCLKQMVREERGGRQAEHRLIPFNPRRNRRR